MTNERAHELFNLLDGQLRGFDLTATETCPVEIGIKDEDLVITHRHSDGLFQCLNEYDDICLVKGDENGQNGWGVIVPPDLLEE